MRSRRRPRRAKIKPMQEPLTTRPIRIMMEPDRNNRTEGIMMEEQQINYTELLEKEYGKLVGAARLIQKLRKMGLTGKEIYEGLESFY